MEGNARAIRVRSGTLADLGMDEASRDGSIAGRAGSAQGHADLCMAAQRIRRAVADARSMRAIAVACRLRPAWS
jgi:hypothetical protein